MTWAQDEEEKKEKVELETQEDEENRLSVASRVKPKQPEKAEEETKEETALLKPCKEIDQKQDDAQV